MDYQKIINLLGNISNQLSKFRIKNWIEINDQSRGLYNTNIEIRFKTTMSESSWWDYIDPYVLVKGTITITGARADAEVRQAGRRNEGIIFKSCAPFISCQAATNNT